MNNKIICFFLGFLFCLLSISFSSQNLISSHYTTKQKLPSNDIYSLSQDSIGKIWLSTNNGVSIYDGEVKKNINSVDGLPENTILFCYPLSDNRQLISTNVKGLFYKTGTVLKQISPQEQIFVNKIIKVRNHFIACSKDKINNLYIINYDNKKDEFYLKAINFKSEVMATDIITINDSTIVAASKNGIYKITFLNKSYVINKISEIKNCNQVALSDSLIYCIYEKKINIINLNTNVIEDTIIVPNALGDILNGVYYNHKMYFSSRLPYKFYCFENNKFIDVTSLFGLKNIYINSLLVDRENNLWITTQGKGLFKLKKSFSQNYKVNASDLNSYVISLHRTKNHNLVLGSYGHFYNVINDSIFIPHYKNKTTQYFYHYGFAESNNKVICFVNKIVNFKPTSFLGTKYYYINARTALFINDSTVLAGLWNMKLKYFKYQHDKFVGDKDSIILSKKVGRINKIIKISNEEIFVGTDLGLYKINLKTKSIHSYKSLVGEIKVNDICFNGNKYYIGTSNGLFILQKNNILRILKIGKQDVSSVNKILYNDSLNQLYIGTNFGLFVITNKKTFFLNEDNGLSFTEVNTIECVDNFVLVGGVNGYDKVNLSEYIRSYKAPDIYINSIQINDSIIENFNKIIKLNNINRIQIKFSGINYNSTNLFYKYKINTSREYLLEKGELNIEDISYGQSIIYLYTSADLINWSNPIKLMFYLDKPFYYEIWFIVLITTLSLGCIFLLFIWRLRIVKIRVKKRETLITELNSIKLRLINTSTKAHFLSNVLVGIQQFILQGKVDIASDYLALFSRHMRNVLESFQKDTHSLEHEMELTNEYIKLEQLRFQNKILFTIQSNLSHNARLIMVPPLLLQPIIENAIEHAFLKSNNKVNTILIKLLEFQDEKIEITIEDNGSGFNNLSINENESFGLKITNDRVNLQPNISVYYYNLNTLDENLRGTRVKFIIHII